MAVADYAGVWVEDEIVASSNPAKHADDMVATMIRERIGWCVVNAAIPGNQNALAMLITAGKARGWGGYGVWAQTLPPQELLARAVGWGAQIIVANPENALEEAVWQDAHLDRLAGWGANAAVCFTEGTWGRDAAKAKRWRDRGVVAMPEAIQSENPQATIPAMLELAQTLGWPAERTAPAVYLTRGYAAGQYAASIDATAGRWSVFRYGDIDPADWEQLRLWPRPVPGQTPPPPPPPPVPVGISVAEAYDRIIEAVNLVDERLKSKDPPQPVLGPAAALYSARLLATTAKNRLWTAARGNATAKFFKDMGLE